jgi:hypothetical protein
MSMPNYLSHSYAFRCDVCRFVTDNKKDYRRHTDSMKHKKMTNAYSLHLKRPVSVNVTQPDTNVIISSWKPAPPAPQPSVQHAFIFDKRIYKYCEKCGQKYCSKSGLWKHRKRCDGAGFIPDIPDATNSTAAHVLSNSTASGAGAGGAAGAAGADLDMKIIMMDMLKNNQEFQHKLIEMLYNQQNTIVASATAAASAAAAACASASASASAASASASAASAVSETTTVVPISNTNNYNAPINSNNNSNNNNNTFKLKFFLNEHCKDAMNITDFAKSINLKDTDLDEFGRMGYVQGMSKLFIDSLKNTDVCKRPIHCSDARRETLYVKDADKWEREDAVNTKITKAVRVVEHKNICLVNEWAKQNPKCEDSSTYENAQYINMSRAVLDGDDKNIAKVIKMVAKEVVIEKP